MVYNLMRKESSNGLRTRLKRLSKEVNKVRIAISMGILR